MKIFLKLISENHPVVNAWPSPWVPANILPQNSRKYTSRSSKWYFSKSFFLAVAEVIHSGIHDGVPNFCFRSPFRNFSRSSSRNFFRSFSGFFFQIFCPKMFHQFIFLKFYQAIRPSEISSRNPQKF